MSYEAALKKAWEDIAQVAAAQALSIRFLGDDYTLDPAQRTLMSLSCNVPARESASVLILHYAAQKLRGLPAPAGEWLTFRELAGIEGYTQGFRERAITPIIRKHGANPKGIFALTGRLSVCPSDGADVAVTIEPFEGVPVLIKIWRGDEEFGPDANMLFDRSITQIFCTEDIVVMAGIVAASV